MKSELLYLNGVFLPMAEGRISVEDRGFQMGDGVYEVVKVLKGGLVWLEDHLDRLRYSLRQIGLERALEGYPLEDVLPELVRRSSVRQGWVYVQVTRGVAPRDFALPSLARPTVLAYARSRRPPTKAQIMAGIALYPVVDIRWARCDIKSTNLLATVLAKEEARRAGADEALFVGPQGEVREGGSSNVFAVIQGVVTTPPPGPHVLAGVTRKHVLEIARRAGYLVEERSFTLQELLDACATDCEVFVASTMRDIMPVVRVGETVVAAGRPGPVTLHLLDLLRCEQNQLVRERM